MPRQTRKLPSALKHGIYSSTALLPGESEAEFDKFHQCLMDDLCPNGPMEEDAVFDIVRLMWRKRNMLTLRLAELAVERSAAIRQEKVMPLYNIDGQEIADAEEEANREVQRELGEYTELIEVGKTATYKGLQQELKIEDLLDAKIDRAVKRLLHLKGIKALTNRTVHSIEGSSSGIS